MPLSGQAVAELQNALISAFSADELTRLVRIHLDENLDAVAGDDNLNQTVFDLITWADRQGRLDELIRGAANVNPGNHELRTWIETHSVQVDASDVPPPAPKTKRPLDLCSSPTSIDSTTESKTDWCTMPPQKQDAPLSDLSTGSLIDLPTVKLPISAFKNVTDPPKLSSIANTKPQQTDNRKLKVFLCHASEDKKTVRKLYHQLKADGVDPWLDEVDILPGQEWQREIPRAVRDADAVLVCLSNSSIDKEGYIKKETQSALDVVNKQPDAQIYLIPLRLEDCSVPANLRRWQWVDLFVEGGYARLIESLRYRASLLGLQSAIDAGGGSSFVTKVKSKRKIPWLVIGGIIAAVAGIFGILNDGFGVWDRIRPEVTVSPTVVVVAANPATDTPVPLTSTSVSPTPANTPTPLPKAGDIKVVNDITFVYIPAGSFTMGSNDGDDDEKLPHAVNVEAFWMMQTEVTKAQYKRCMDDGLCTEVNDERIADATFGNHPIVGVDWFQANTFAEWTGGRLPTEAEWEYACRGSGAHIYPWGNEEPSKNRLNYLDNIGDTTKVAGYSANTNGLYDMAGNVWEWTSTLYAPDYPYNPDDGRENPEADGLRTFRGGSFHSGNNFVRCADRGWNESYSSGSTNLGFRVMSDESSDFLSIDSAIPLNTPMPPINTAITPRPRSIVTSLGGLNLRSSPSILGDANIIRLSEPDDVVFLLGNKEAPPGEITLVEVETDEGEIGWVSEAALEDLPE